MISVIVPVYDGERTLEKCIRSIQRQEGVALEILLIDDGSRDQTAALCRKLADSDDRIRRFHQEHAGVSAARNYGLKEAMGTYITFVDCDDTLPPGALASLYRAAKDGADFVIGSHSYVRGPWNRAVRHRMSDSLPSLMSLMCGKLYCRSLIEKGGLQFHEGLPYGEDTVFNLSYAALARKPLILSQVVYHCRMGGAASTLRYYPDRDKIALTLIEAYRDHGAEISAIAEREWEETVLHYFVHCPAEEARTKSAQARETLREYLPEGLPVDPILHRRWLRILLRRWKKRAWRRRP